MRITSINLGEGTSTIAAADMNGDGSWIVTDNATVVLGNGNGTFQPPNLDSAGYSCFGFGSPNAAIFADFNRDGKPDLRLGRRRLRP